jgi:putative aldouronate transport system permease protein
MSMEGLGRRSKEDKLFDLINIVILSFVALLVLYPLYFVIIASISNPDRIYSGEMWYRPLEISFDGYRRIFRDGSILTGYRNTILYTSVGTFINVVLTIFAAYALSRKDLYGRNVIMLLLVFTMFFSGGLIPTYLLVKKIGLLNTMWALILPKAVGVFNVIVAKSFFEQSISPELLDAGKIDGCSDFRFFSQIVMPLSKPIIAVMSLFYAVDYWNSYFDALIYFSNEKMYPLQLVLRGILIQTSATFQMVGDLESMAARQKVAEMVKFGVIIVGALPLLIVYPFIQKYFVKGVMIGSVKG